MTTATEAPKRGRGRPKKVVPSDQFGPPAPPPLDKDAILRSAIEYLEINAGNQLQSLDTGAGIPSDAILDFLGTLWGAKPTGTNWAAKGGGRPCVWLGTDTAIGRPTLQGEDLAIACRRLFNLGCPLLASGRKKGSKAATEAPTPESGKPLGKMEVIEQRAVDVTKIFPSPENPRFDWDEDFLRQLGESMRDHTQLDPIIIRESGELIDGESRWRAAKLVGLSTLDAKIVRCTDAEAALVRMMSYRQRRDLNAIEEARGLKLLLGKYGCSQRELEDRIRISQGQISNRVRLLDLPEGWQAKIISNEITATDGRVLATFADRPKVFQWLDEHYEWRKSTGFGKFTDIVVDALQYASRPITKGQDGPKFKITAELREKLDIVEVKVGRMEEPRAFDTELWGQLQSEAIKASADRAAARAKSATKPTVALTPHALHGMWAGWFGRQIAARFAGKLKKADHDVLSRLSLLACLDDGSLRGTFDAFKETNPVLTLMQKPRDWIDGRIRERFLEQMADGEIYGLGDLADVVEIAAELGITFDEFVPDALMLDVLSDEAVLELRALWPEPKAEKSKAKRIERLVESWEAGWIPDSWRLPALEGARI